MLVKGTQAKLKNQNTWQIIFPEMVVIWHKICLLAPLSLIINTLNLVFQYVLVGRNVLLLTVPGYLFYSLLNV